MVGWALTDAITPASRHDGPSAYYAPARDYVKLPRPETFDTPKNYYVFLCAEAGIESTLDNSAAYLKGWLGALKVDSRLVVTAASAVQRATDFILNWNAQETAEGEPASE